LIICRPVASRTSSGSGVGPGIRNCTAFGADEND
jgi:hypothetical protein